MAIKYSLFTGEGKGQPAISTVLHTCGEKQNKKQNTKKNPKQKTTKEHQNTQHQKKKKKKAKKTTKTQKNPASKLILFHRFDDCV